MAEYIRLKMKVLRHMGIQLSKDERKILKNKRTEISADNFVRSVILKCWED